MKRRVLLTVVASLIIVVSCQSSGKKVAMAVESFIKQSYIEETPIDVFFVPDWAEGEVLDHHLSGNGNDSTNDLEWIILRVIRLESGHNYSLLDQLKRSDENFQLNTSALTRYPVIYDYVDMHGLLGYDLIYLGFKEENESSSVRKLLFNRKDASEQVLLAKMNYNEFK